MTGRFRPAGVVIEGRLEGGLEVELEAGTVVALRETSLAPEPWVLSPAFVNAHSHLEYRGLQGKINETGFFAWIRTLTEMKRGQDAESVRADCRLAAKENRSTGVALIGEHSDRVGSGAELASVEIGGTLFQEVITFLEHADPSDRLRLVQDKLTTQSREFVTGRAVLSPHAPYTVTAPVLQALSRSEPVLSIHVAESLYETALFATGDGPFADLYRSHGVPLPARAPTPVQYLDQLEFLRIGVQCVHLCTSEKDDIETIARTGATVAHCPRSNQALGCPPAPVWRMLEAGIDVGLGLDSAASSGPIDMFHEMQAALTVANDRQEPLTASSVWDMATTRGARSVHHPEPWEISLGATVPLIGIDVPWLEGPPTFESLIASSEPSSVRWISTISGR